MCAIVKTMSIANTTIFIRVKFNMVSNLSKVYWEDSKYMEICESMSVKAICMHKCTFVGH